MTIDAKTKVCGLIGCPVGHSVSPVIHNSLAEIYGHNLVYVPLEVAPGKLKSAVEGADAFGFWGMNVTVPYKSEVMPYLKEIDPLAKRIGAVNTLVHAEGGYKGYNTDMPGLYRAMCADGVQIAGEEVILLGAGGAARAIAFLLLEKGAKHVYILNRSRERAEILTDEVNNLAKSRHIRAVAGFTEEKEIEKTAASARGEKSNGFDTSKEKLAETGIRAINGLSGRTEINAASDRFATAYGLDEYHKLDNSRQYLVIQATNVGMFPHTERAVIEDEAFYSLVKVGYDVIFNPPATRFMQLVRRAGGKAHHGLKMLLYQGLIAYELWNDVEIAEETAKEIYGRMKKALAI